MNEQLEGQMSIFDFIKPECSFSGHTCNKQNLWEVAHTLDNIHCPETCCRQCNIRLCGARCNGSEEPGSKTPAQEYFEETGKTTYWQDSQGKPHRWWRTEDEYIRENPTCFYVFGHYLDREAGWHKVPDQLPTFTEWTVIDVVVFGKKTSTAWMEHRKWEAKDWTFRSVDQRRNTETIEILAWKISEEQT